MATAYPAGHHSPPEVTTKPSQWVVPRATSRRSISRTTSAARSIQPRNGGDQRPRRTSGPSHHALAAATRPVHHHVTGLRHHARRVTSHSPVGTAARIVAVALTPPQHEHGEGRERGGPARPDPALGREHDREEDRRHEEHRERLGRQPADGGEHPRAQRVRERGEHPRRGAADAERAEQGVGGEEPHGEEDPPPEALRDPHRQTSPSTPKNGPIGKR